MWGATSLGTVAFSDRRPTAPQTYKPVCLSRRIILHSRRRVKTGSFHIKSRICQPWPCASTGQPSAGAAGLGGQAPSAPPPHHQSAPCTVPPPCAWRQLSPLSRLCGAACAGRGGMMPERRTEWQTDGHLGSFPPKCPWTTALTLWSSVWPLESHQGGGAWSYGSLNPEVL